MKKKLIAAAFILLVGGCSNTPYAFKEKERTENAPEEQLDFKIGYALGTPDGLNDNTFEAISWEGVIQYVNRYPRVKVQRAVPLDDTDDKRRENLDDLLTIECDVIIALGEAHAEIFQEEAAKNPEVTFILFQGGGIKPESENFVNIEFEDQQSSFLGGVAAALNTDSGKVGFMGGKHNASLTRQSLGFEGGVRYANANFQTEAEVQEPQYAESFEDVVKGRKLAKKMYEDDIDVIFSCAGTTGIGAIEQAKVLLEKDKSVWLIGVDNDLYEYGKIHDDRSVILTSIIKKMDVVIYEILEDYARDRFPGGQYVLKTLQEGSVGLPKENKNFDEKTRTLISQTEDLIREGSLVIPFELEELEAFVKSIG